MLLCILIQNPAAVDEIILRVKKNLNYNKRLKTESQNIYPGMYSSENEMRNPLITCDANRGAETRGEYIPFQ